MKRLLLLIFVLSAVACASKSTQDEAAVITRVGVIKSKQAADMNQVEKQRRTNTSIYGSVSSGGGVSIGIGFLFGVLGSGGSGDHQPVRYEVELDDGGQMTIYHESRDFEVEDCVRISVHPDEEKHPPTMERFKDGCDG